MTATKTDAKTVDLTDRALIRVAGDEAHHFLQNLVTADLEETDRTGASSAALLTPQGKILFDFLIYNTGDGYLLDAPAAIAADLLKRLSFYRLRAKVDLALEAPEMTVFALWDGAAEAPGARVDLPDPRLPALGRRVVGTADLFAQSSGADTLPLAAYDRHRIALGVPEGLKDYVYSDLFPHDVDLDQLGGVSFTKGCYVGQEVVSRVHHRGTARKRFLKAAAKSALPEMGTPVTADGKAIGAIGSSAVTGDSALALAVVRLDKAAQAKENGTPLDCGGVEIQVSIPDWAAFTWPETAAADG